MYCWREIPHAHRKWIKNHLSACHGVTKVSKKDLTDCLKILCLNNSIGYLRMAEATFIKELKPSLNSQEEGCDRLLKNFKH